MPTPRETILQALLAALQTVRTTWPQRFGLCNFCRELKLASHVAVFTACVDLAIYSIYYTAATAKPERCDVR
jgi:hypothetical protein